jgi:hypothetical protein
MDTFFAIPSDRSYAQSNSIFMKGGYDPYNPPLDVIIEDIVSPFYRTPYRTPSNSSTYIIEDVVRPIITRRPILTTYPSTVTNFGISTMFQPNSAFYYDSGVGENPLARHETNVELRHAFLDKWLYEDYPDILRLLKVDNGVIKVLSSAEAVHNNISNDTEEDLMKKSDFIGQEILTRTKNMKILNTLVEKNNMKWYDLPHNKHYVRKAQAKYVKRKLEEMKK